ncbi:mis18-binding protein 1 isoform X1 [Danio rerio]|uniref:Mis18-binding protein 1 isoform X1 n=7 Tax=Danio rerio TaxID=7955 RepID=A0AC58HM97_DANRE
MYHPLQDYFIAPGVPKSSDMITPVKTKPKIASSWAPGSGRKLSNRDVLVMNSTAQSAEENSPNIPCELSSINATADVVPQNKADLMLKKGTETPAKIFARMKAKVQRQNSAGHEAVSVHVKNLEICNVDQSNPVIQISRKTNISQETYVIAVSPPQSSQPEETDSSQERSERQIEVLNTESESFIAPFALLEKMPRVMEAKRKQMPENPCRGNKQPLVLLEKVVPVEMLAQLQQKPVSFVSGLKDIRNKGTCVVFGERSISEEKDNEKDLQIEQSSSPESDPFSRSESQSDCTEIVPGPTQPNHNLLDDPLLLLSPRVLIPRKQASVLQSKRQARQVDEAVDEATNVTGIHLRDWIVKLLNKELVVDGIRIDTMIPWHSSFIVERVSSNVLKTSSGRTYVLIGKMAKHPNSLFPSWFLKKFLFGFPKMWKEYLDQFLSAYTGSQKSQKDKSSSVKPSKARKNSTSKHSKVQDITTSPVTPIDGVHQDSAKVSRSGRLIKPPLEYWKGGRIVMDSEMNVTVHEDYSTSVPSTPKKPATSQIAEEKSFRPKTMERGRCITSSSEDELSVPRRRIKQVSKPQQKIPSNPLPAENTARSKPPRSQKGPLVVTTMSDSIPAAKQNASRPQRASLRKQRSAEKDTFLDSGTEIKEKTKVDAVNGNFIPGDEQETGSEEDPKSKRNSKSSQKQIQVEPQPLPHDYSSLRRSSRISSRIIYSTDSNSSFTSPDLPRRQREKKSTAQKQLTKSLRTSVLQNSIGHKEQNDQESMRCSRRPKVISQKSPDDVLVDASISLLTDDNDDEDRVQHEQKATLLLRKAKPRKGKSQPKSIGTPVSSESMHSEHSEDEESVSNNRRSKKSEKGKANSRSKKTQAENNMLNKQEELLDGKWTEEELQKLHEGVNSLPKHQSGYWAHVAYVVGTRSAEECHEQYNAHQRKSKIPRQRPSKKPAATEESSKEVVEITAKAGTLKRRHQMRHFLEHMPKDDHDDVFTSSPMHSKQIKLPVFAANGDDKDFSQLQNPQTPSSSMSTSAKTPQCLHISPGMMGSINKNNLDKYIFHLQKNQKGRKRNKKVAQTEKLTPTPAARKTLKRCVAEDDDFVVWNMLSDKDMPSREDDSDEEDDYFMEYC